MKNFDVSLIEHGLANDVFTPSNVLDLLYHPLHIIGIMSAKKDSQDTIAGMTWPVNNFTAVPVATRKKLLLTCFEANKEETTLDLNRRFTCVIYTLLKEQDNIMPEADWCTALFESASPVEVMQEIHLWHKCGLKMNRAKFYLLKRIWSNMLESEPAYIPEVQLPYWVNKQKTLLKQLLSRNKKSAQHRILKLTLTESFIREQIKSSAKDLKELEALKKEAQKLKATIDKLLKDRFLIEIKLSVLEIYPMLQENFPKTDKN